MFLARKKKSVKLCSLGQNYNNSASLPDSIDFSFLLWSPGSLALSLPPLSLAQLPNLSVRCLCLRRGEDKQEQHEEDEAEHGGQDAHPYVLNRYEPFFILSEVNRDFFLTPSIASSKMSTIILQSSSLYAGYWLNPDKISSALCKKKP
jgi:hypothetical protein